MKYVFNENDFREVRIPKSTRERFENTTLVWEFSKKQSEAWQTASRRVREYVGRLTPAHRELVKYCRPTIPGTKLQVHYGYDLAKQSRGCVLIGDAHKKGVSWSDGCVITNIALLTLSVAQEATNG